MGLEDIHALRELQWIYLVNAEVYTGKVEADLQILVQLGVTGALVARLCKPFEGQNHCVFTDRFYTSVNVAEYLLDKQGTRLCGTAMTNRKKFPKQIIQKEMERSSHSLLYNGKTAAVVWCDKKPMYFLATKYVTDANTTVLRYDAKEHKRVPVSCPAVVKAYNELLHGRHRQERSDDQTAKMQTPLQMAKTSYDEILCVVRLQCLRHMQPLQTTHRTRKAHSHIQDVCSRTISWLGEIISSSAAAYFTSVVWRRSCTVTE